MEVPYGGRASIIENFDGLEIIIPTAKNWFVIPFLCIWLCFWLIGEIFVLITVTSGNAGGAPDLFLAVWLCGWTVGGFFVIRTLLWNFAGKEVISIRTGQITLDKSGMFFYKAKTYDLHEAKNFRAQEDNIPYGPFGNMSMINMFNFKNTGTIRFDYGLDTVKFASGIAEAEATFILEKLRNKKYIS